MAGNLFTLAQYLVNNYMVRKVVIMQILQRLEATRPIKYPVDVNWFGKRCLSLGHGVSSK